MLNYIHSFYVNTFILAQVDHSFQVHFTPHFIALIFYVSSFVSSLAICTLILSNQINVLYCWKLLGRVFPRTLCCRNLLSDRMQKKKFLITIVECRRKPLISVVAFPLHSILPGGNFHAIKKQLGNCQYFSNLLAGTESKIDCYSLQLSRIH